jgi:hypothetical protein
VLAIRFGLLDRVPKDRIGQKVKKVYVVLRIYLVTIHKLSIIDSGRVNLSFSHL